MTGTLTPSPLVCPVDGRCLSVLRGRALLGCTRGSVWALSPPLGSSCFVADPAAGGVTFVVPPSGKSRRSRLRRVLSSPAHGRCGTRVARVRLRVVAAGPAAGGGSRPWGVTHASHKGAAEGTEDFVLQARVRRLGFRLSADTLNRYGALRHSCPQDKWVLARLGYWNWRWNKARGNYSTTELELLTCMLVLFSQCRCLGSIRIVWP